MTARHLPGLDTLRACAILMVIPSHAREYLKFPAVKMLGTHGWAGVDLFFVLSGFLIGSQLLQGVARDGRVDFGRFYLKRSLRILPAFLAVLLLYHVWPAFRERPVLDPAWRFLLFVMNFSRVGDAFSHAWSLCVEEHFYLVVPALFALHAWRPRLLRPAAAVAAVLVGGLALRYAIRANGVDFWVGIYRPTYSRLDGLTVGVGLALLKGARPAVWAKLVARPWTAFTGGIALVALGLWLYTGEKDAVAAAVIFPLVAVGFGALVVAAQAPEFWLGRWRIPGAAALAALAYTLYLTHKQMIHMATVLVPQAEAPVATVALAAALTLLAACLLHFGVEKPCLALRARLLASHGLQSIQKRQL